MKNIKDEEKLALAALIVMFSAMVLTTILLTG